MFHRSAKDALPNASTWIPGSVRKSSRYVQILAFMKKETSDTSSRNAHHGFRVAPPRVVPVPVHTREAYIVSTLFGSASQRRPHHSISSSVPGAGMSCLCRRCAICRMPAFTLWTSTAAVSSERRLATTWIHTLRSASDIFGIAVVASLISPSTSTSRTCWYVHDRPAPAALWHFAALS